MLRASPPSLRSGSHPALSKAAARTSPSVPAAARPPVTRPDPCRPSPRSSCSAPCSSGTEVSLFAIDDRGGLRHLSTSYLRSNDYYSSRNYSARLVDGKLVFHTPLWLDSGDPLASRPAMREWRPGRDTAGAAAGGFERIVTPRRIYRPARSLEGSEQLTLHTITQCGVGGTRFECDATVVVGPFSRVFYVSPKAVYVWAADWPYRGRDHEAPEPSTLFRLPLDGGAPSALTVAGTPVDQFSFLESEDGHINVLVQPEGTGDDVDRGAAPAARGRQPEAAPGAARPVRRRPGASAGGVVPRAPAAGARSAPQPLRRRSPALRQRERLVE